MNQAQWQRIGASFGLLFVALIVASVFIGAATPDATEPTAEIVQTLTDDSGGTLAFGYVLGLQAGIFVIFAAALWGVLRRGEGELAGASVVALAGAIGTSLILLLTQVVLVAATYAADKGAEPEAIRGLFELVTPLYTSSAVTLVLFLGGTAMSAIPSKALPAWLGWVAAALAAVFFVSLHGIFSDPEGEGILGIFFFLGELGLVVWVLAASIVMLRAARDAKP